MHLPFKALSAQPDAQQRQAISLVLTNICMRIAMPLVALIRRNGIFDHQVISNRALQTQSTQGSSMLHGQIGACCRSCRPDVGVEHAYVRSYLLAHALQNACGLI
eukprot:6198824-Pleurochrysis_carterae.AAC.2